jgi:hypothetical protein
MASAIAWIDTIDGLTVDERGRIVFGAAFSAQDFGRLLSLIRQHVGEFAVYDPLYPSVSDPGAYLSYSKVGAVDGSWCMTLGNHGWSGGIYQIQEKTITHQLENLLVHGKLESIGINHVHFFHNRKLQSDAASEEQNRYILAIHSAENA